MSGIVRPSFTLAVDFGNTLASVHYGRTSKERHPAFGRAPEINLMPDAKEVIDQLHDMAVRVVLAANPDAVTPLALQALAKWIDRWELQIGQVVFPTDRHLIDADLWLEDDPTVIDILDDHERPRVIFDQPWNRHLTGTRVRGWSQVPNAVARARMRAVRGLVVA